jgi:hypothetical protein
MGIGKNAAAPSPDLLRRAKDPGPCSYKVKTSTFDPRKGAYFGAGRKVWEKVYIKSNPPTKGWTEPGNYNLQSFVDEKKKAVNKHFFFGKRIKSHGEDPHKIKFPGPGEYEAHKVNAISKDGRYALSKSKNTNSINIGRFSSRKSSKEVIKMQPGPGEYNKPSASMTRSTTFSRGGARFDTEIFDVLKKEKDTSKL